MNCRPQTETPTSAADLAGMGRHPQPFTLLLDAQPANSKQLKCIEVVRAIPGKRLVCQAEWQGDSVFAKLYIDSIKGWKRELQGLNSLHAAGIAAPLIVHVGTADQGAVHIILLGPVDPATSLETAWAEAADDAARIKLLQLAVITIARHHHAGLQQRDIHLDNFLLSGEQLYTLDGGGIASSGEAGLSVRHSCDNLGVFFAQFYPRFDTLIERVLPDYHRQRSWPSGQLPLDKLMARVIFFRRRRQQHFLKKIFRDCSAFICRKSWSSFHVCNREQAGSELLALLADPDASLQQADARYLKQGNTCTLWLITVDGQQLVVKRYNIKSFAHRISRAFRHTRAEISWKNAHRLAMYGILSARPVALCEQRYGPLRGKAWLITEYLGDENILQLCNTHRPDSKITVVSSTTALLAQLAQCRISHGDMKGSNFMQTPQGTAVIDLDSMCEHESNAGFRSAQRRDLQRFMRNWRKCPQIEALFKDSMQKNKVIKES